MLSSVLVRFLHVSPLLDGKNDNNCFMCELLSFTAALMFGTACTDGGSVVQLPTIQHDTSSCEVIQRANNLKTSH